MVRHFIKDAAAGVAVMFAFMAPVLCLVAALAVDCGTFYMQKRALQAATDLAAIASAQNPSQATLVAQQNLMLNGFSRSAVQSAQLGVYAPTGSNAVAQWFTPGAGYAVQVSTKIQAPFYFANILNMMRSAPCADPACNSALITATATAMVDPKAAFSLGSGLANLNGGVLNAVLGGLLGANISLSVMDYQALAGANIDMFAFANALATRLNLTAVTYSDLANMQVASPTVLSALADVAGASALVANDIKQLSTLAPSSTIQIGKLISFGDYGSLQVGSPEPITVKADALDLVSAIAQIANGQHQVQTALNVNLPPVAAATLQLTVGERPVNSGFVSVGSAGATVHTAQTRLYLNLQITQLGSSSLVNLPLYLELAAGSASLTAVGCSANPTQQTATLAVTPAVVNAWIGNVTASDMTNYSVEPTPTAANLVNLLGIGAVTGRANATITNLSSTTMTFNYDDISNGVRKTTSTTDYISSLLYNLFANLQLSVNLLGLNVTAPPAASALLGTTLAAATAPIDQILSQLLTSLGLSLGNAYTQVSGVNCGAVKLVL